MTSLNASATTGQTMCSNPRSDETAGEGWYPQSLMLRMMRDASRGMLHSTGRMSAPRLDPQALSENLRRDIGVIDWVSRER